MPERKKILLRLDPAVHEALARWAADDLRSVNSQIEFALRLALRQAGRLGPVVPEPGRPSEDPLPDVRSPSRARSELDEPS